MDSRKEPIYLRRFRVDFAHSPHRLHLQDKFTRLIQEQSEPLQSSGRLEQFDILHQFEQLSHFQQESKEQSGVSSHSVDSSSTISDE